MSCCGLVLPFLVSGIMNWFHSPDTCCICAGQCKFPCWNECKWMHIISVLHLNVHTKGSRELEVRELKKRRFWLDVAPGANQHMWFYFRLYRWPLVTSLLHFATVYMKCHHSTFAASQSPPTHPFFFSPPFLTVFAHINHCWQSISSLSKSFKWPP